MGTEFKYKVLACGVALATMTSIGQAKAAEAPRNADMDRLQRELLDRLHDEAARSLQQRLSDDLASAMWVARQELKSSTAIAAADEDAAQPR